MSISKQEVEHVAKLARLRLSDEETEQFTLQLNNILQFAKKLDELDTEKVAPTSHVHAMQNVLREDEVQPSLPEEKVFHNAPDHQEGMFRVPKVFDE